MLESTHIYRHTGWQRPVFLQPGTVQARFAAEGVSGLQVSFDRVEDLQKGKGQWLPHESVHDGCGGGYEHGITAVRVCVDAGGEGELRVVQEG